MSKKIAFAMYGMLMLALAACAMLQTPGQMPNATQIAGACQAERAAGKTGLAAPDCNAYYAFQQVCNVEALGGAVNPLVATINPVAGSVLTTQQVVSSALCKAQGFYGPVATAPATPAKAS